MPGLWIMRLLHFNLVSIALGHTSLPCVRTSDNLVQRGRTLEKKICIPALIPLRDDANAGDRYLVGTNAHTPHYLAQYGGNSGEQDPPLYVEINSDGFVLLGKRMIRIRDALTHKQPFSTSSYHSQSYPSAQHCHDC